MAGVSKAAASRVLSPKDSGFRATAATKQRILDAARDLDYRPNALAQSLATGRTGAIKIVMPGTDYLQAWTGFMGVAMDGIMSEAFLAESRSVYRRAFTRS